MVNHGDLYQRYYVNQAGSGLPVFHGREYQRGYGIGSVFSGLSKLVMPLIKSGAKALGKQALQSGTQVLSDVLQGQNLKQAALRRSKEAGRHLLETASERMLTPPGERVNINRKKRKKTISSKRTKRRKVINDIFE